MGKGVQFLLDTGCSDNVLSRSLFNQLPPTVRDSLVVDQISAQMADGSGLLIYGSITLPCRVRTVQLSISFRVANITDDAILGMRFFNEHDCSLLMNKGVLVLQDKPLSCVDRTGHPTVNRVQVTHTTTIEHGMEAQLLCRVTSPPSSSLGIVEHFSTKDHGVLLAATLAKADNQGRLIARCLNTSTRSITLNAGTLIGVYTPLSSNQVYPDVKACSVPTDTNSQVTLPSHVEQLYEQAAKNCETPCQRQQ